MPEILRTKCAVYLRPSLGRDTELQAQTCRDIAVSRGWEIVEMFTDTAGDRDQYTRLQEAHERKEFASVICWDIENLVRGPQELDYWVGVGKAANLQLVAAADFEAE